MLKCFGERKPCLLFQLNACQQAFGALIQGQQIISGGQITRAPLPFQQFGAVLDPTLNNLLPAAILLFKALPGGLCSLPVKALLAVDSLKTSLGLQRYAFSGASFCAEVVADIQRDGEGQPDNALSTITTGIDAKGGLRLGGTPCHFSFLLQRLPAGVGAGYGRVLQ